LLHWQAAENPVDRHPLTQAACQALAGRPDVGRYTYLLDTYDTERIKTLSVWSQCLDGDMTFRPEPRARTPREHMVHQCAGEDTWMRTMLGIDLGEPPLPPEETRLALLERYAAASAKRLGMLREKPDEWFEEAAGFFDVSRSRAWILLRRVTHSAHHRGQLTTYLRVLGRELYSTYGPTADTGGLMQNQAAVIYRYQSVEELLQAELKGEAGPRLPGPGSAPLSERPDR